MSWKFIPSRGREFESPVGHFFFWKSFGREFESPADHFFFLEEFLGIFRRNFGTPTVFPHGEYDGDVYFYICIDPTLIFREIMVIFVSLTRFFPKNHGFFATFVFSYTPNTMTTEIFKEDFFQN